MNDILPTLRNLWQNIAGGDVPVRKILVLDDDPDVVETVSRLLAQGGYQTGTATSWVQAKEQLGQVHFDMILVDLLMPDTNGLEVLREVRRQCPGIKVVIMTGHGDWDTYLQAMSNEAYDYIQKPIRARELLALAQKALEGLS